MPRVRHSPKLRLKVLPKAKLTASPRVPARVLIPKARVPLTMPTVNYIRLAPRAIPAPFGLSMTRTIPSQAVSLVRIALGSTNMVYLDHRLSALPLLSSRVLPMLTSRLTTTIRN